jgi:hypothetical protein
MFFGIPDPTFPSRIRIKEFKYFNPKKWFLSFRKCDPGCSFRIHGSKRHWIPDPDPQHCLKPDTQLNLHSINLSNLKKLNFLLTAKPDHYLYPWIRISVEGTRGCGSGSVLNYSGSVTRRGSLRNLSKSCQGVRYFPSCPRDNIKVRLDHF